MVVGSSCSISRSLSNYFRKGDPFQGPKLSSCLTVGNTLSEETYVLTNKRFHWEGHLGREQQGKGTQENCSATLSAVLDFKVVRLVSGWSLANHSNSEFFLVGHASLSQDGC